MSRQLRSVFGTDSASRRSVIGAASVLLVVITVETVGLRSGTLGLVLVGTIAAIALAVIVLRADLERAALCAALACAFTLTWNGWFIGPIRPGDVLILFTLILVLAANPNGAFRTPPWWIKQLAIVIIVVAVITIYFPPDPIYLANRIVLTATGKPTVDTKGSLAAANLGIAFKFVVAVLATPMAFTGVAIRDRRAVRWLGVAFATGAGLSGLVATSDHLGTNLGHFLTRLPNVGNRQIGFAYQPNFLAAGLCLAAPLAFWMVVTGSRRERLFGWAALLGCVGGVYASGSRGGAVSILLVLGLSMVLQKRTRVHAPYVALAALFVGTVVATLLPTVWMKILRATRLVGGVITAGSDTVRSIVGAQGVRDFYHSPLHGIGLQVSFDASQVYLQELASGGLLLFFAMQAYMLGAIITALRRMNVDPLAGALLASLLITLVLNVFEADLTDRFYYVPAAILVALMHTARTGSRQDADDDAAEAELVTTG
jgi:hypothetical protein